MWFRRLKSSDPHYQFENVKHEDKLGLRRVELSLRLTKHHAVKPYKEMDEEHHAFLT
jgi:hypothetical protein